MADIDTGSLAYHAGIRARRSGHPEPACPYESDTQQYSEFAYGFMSDPFPDTLLEGVAMKLNHRSESP